MNLNMMPTPEALIELEPEEIGKLILTFLWENAKENAQNLVSSPSLIQYMGPQNRMKIQKVLMEGWGWLVSEGLIARQPDESAEWYFLSRRGQKLKQSGDLNEYLQTRSLARDLDPILEAKVKPLFLRGSLDAAVFQAFKEVEVRMREAARLGNEYYGKTLVQKCFGPEDGILVAQTQEPSEREGLFLLFLGSIGLFKNPHSHRNIELPSNEAAVLINFADYLLKTIDSRMTENPSATC